MAAKIPIRTVYVDGSATGLSEFQSGEFVDYSYGGTGLAALGSAGQVLKVNAGASALEYGGVESLLNIDGMTDGTSITVAATDQIAISDAGTEKRINASQLDTFVSGTTSTLTNKTLTSPTINGGTFSGTFTGTQDITGVVLSGASPLVFEGATADNYETTLAFVDPTADRTVTVPNATDTLVGRATTDTLTNKTLTSAVINGTISGTSIKDEDDMSSDSASYLATQQSIKAYVDAVQGANITEQNQFMQNPTNVTTTQTSTILTSQHAWLMGPITVNSGITWTIVGTLKFIS